MDRGKFIYVSYINASADKVWAALIEGEFTRQYWKHEHVVKSWTPGSDWKLVANDAQGTVKHIGKVVESVPNKRLVLTWGDPADAAHPKLHSRVAIDIESVDEAVRVTVTHEDLSADMEKRITRGWPLVLSSLKSFLETGRPVKF